MVKIPPGKLNERNSKQLKNLKSHPWFQDKSLSYHIINPRNPEGFKQKKETKPKQLKCSNNKKKVGVKQEKLHPKKIEKEEAKTLNLKKKEKDLRGKKKKKRFKRQVNIGKFGAWNY